MAATLARRCRKLSRTTQKGSAGPIYPLSFPRPALATPGKYSPLIFLFRIWQRGSETAAFLSLCRSSPHRTPPFPRPAVPKPCGADCPYPPAVAGRLHVESET